MKKSIVIVFCFLMTLVASQASAATINLAVGMGGVAGDHILGEIFTRNDLQGGGCGQECADAAAVNGLLPLSLGQRSGNDPEYYRANNAFAGQTLSAATATGAVDTGNSSTIVLSQVFKYLVVGYDGPNGGSEVYYIGDLAVGDTLNLVPAAFPSIGKGVDCGSASTPDCGHLVASDAFAITHSTLLNPTSGTPTQTGVPDGGTTMSLLGLAMAGLSLVARRMK